MEWSLHHGMALLVSRVAAFSSADVFRFHYGLLVLPTVGGLASGIVAAVLCPNFVGPGTELMTRAFHRRGGALELRGPAVKVAAAIGVISCGGSAGPEGPIAALGAAWGSTFGRLFNLSAAQRRILLIAGCAAGVGAMFRCPLGGTLFAVSVLYSEPEYESDAIVPSLVASVASYSVVVAFWGHTEYLVLGAKKLAFNSPWELVPFIVLGPLCGLMTIWFGTCFRMVHAVKARLHRMPVWMVPALGGLVTGGIACLLPQVMDARYEFVKASMDGSLFATGGDGWWWVGLFGMLALLKCLATGCTIGSGAAGGVLGPSLAIGAATGAMLGALCQALFPDMFPETLRQALIPVGMGGVLAASMRVPMAAIIMIAEMTGSYGLIVPIMVVCVTSYVVGRHWGLNSEQVPTASESPVHAADSVLRLLQTTPVADLTDYDWRLVISPHDTLGDIGKLIEPGERPTFMVVDDGRLAGVISLPDVDRVLLEPHPNLGRVVIADDIMTERVTTLQPDHNLYYALEIFRNENHDVLPVVSKAVPHRFLGVLTRRRVFDAMLSRVSGLKEFIVQEHKGLLAFDEEAQLDHLLMPVGPSNRPAVRRLMVPLSVVGQSIRHAQFRNRFGLQIVAIEQPDGSVQCPPDLDEPLDVGHRLLVIANGHGKRPDAAATPSSASAASAAVASTSREET